MNGAARIATPEKSRYIAVVRAKSSVHFKEGDPLIARDWNTEHGKVGLVFQTRYLEKGFEASVPGDLWVDVRGPALSAAEA